MAQYFVACRKLWAIHISKKYNSCDKAISTHKHACASISRGCDCSSRQLWTQVEQCLGPS